MSIDIKPGDVTSATSTGTEPTDIILYGKAEPAPSGGGGLLLEDGVSFLLLESGDFLLLEG